MVTELDLDLPDGGRLHAYDTGGDDRLPVLWHHGTPNVGAPPAPLFAAADRLGVRWFSYDRPGYGGSTRRPGRDVASAAGYAARVADALGIDRFATMGHSGGAPHALACAALLADRVSAVVAGAGLAPYGAAGLDWFDGMAPSAEASLRAAVAGREAKERYEASGAEGEPGFIPADLAALTGPWAWFGDVVGAAVRGGPGGHVDDDLAYVGPWGFDPARVTAPVLLLHGGRDRMVPATHSRWLADRCPTAQLRLSPEDGHISVLAGAEDALDWLSRRSR
ncbi:alpha/beta fold hydrolase [Micromonospora sp. NPDC000089]|uniref:alpha/beta fold hydrolase n=1 Tax=unclassified Micromonospora TaxID=2617518 RepID=UPI00367E913F